MILSAVAFWLAWCIVVAVVAGSRNREPALWLLTALVISPLQATIAPRADADPVARGEPVARYRLRPRLGG
jgi:hypothetical protein